MSYNSVADNTDHLHSFSCYCLRNTRNVAKLKIPREFDLTAVQGHPRSLILASMESPYVTFYLSLIVTLAVSATIFEIIHT